MALQKYAQPMKDTLDVFGNAIDALVKAEQDDGKIDGKEALAVMGGMMIELIPVFLPLLSDLLSPKD